VATLNTSACIDADDVKEIIDTDLDDGAINFFINLAYRATRRLSGALGECGGSDAECDIQRLLAAHFITMRERQVKSQSVGGEWSVTYFGKDGLGLEASLYGQQALALDCSGLLAKAGLKYAAMRVISYEDLEEQEPSAEWWD
jgi:hypothetical protein